MGSKARLVIAAIFLSTPLLAQASEADFLSRFEGSWSGGGAVKVRADAAPVNVRCSLTSNAEDEALSMDGTCRAMVIASRRIAADIMAADGAYQGTYVGAGSGTASLSGTRSGDTINLAIRWAREVNGDRQAKMEVASLGDGRMRLRTIDVDPATGNSVVTSNIDLVRN